MIFFQPHNNLYYVTCSSLIVSTLMAILCIQWKTCIHCKCMGYAKIQLGCNVDVKLHISSKVNLQLLTHMMKFWSVIKDRVLALNALQQATVGSSFSLLTQKGTNLQQNYSSLNKTTQTSSTRQHCYV